MQSTSPTTFQRHTIISSAIVHIDAFVKPQERSRNSWVIYHPEDNPADKQKELLRFTNPRISSCKNFFEEDVALLEKPDKLLGIARKELSSSEKLNLSKKKMTRELVYSLFTNKKQFHTALLLM